VRTLISGGSGLIGSALRGSLEADGHTVASLTRRPELAGDVGWRPLAGVLDSSAIKGFDAIVHLAGESISSRWTSRKKDAIRESRIRGTRLLAETIADLTSPPRVFVSSSATGYYGDRGDDLCDESMSAGAGFLADVAEEWEIAASVAGSTTRVVIARTGIVLSREGGALAELERPLRLGVAGKVGSGRQWWSWISLRDQVRALRHLIDTETLAGPVNLVAPSQSRNDEFMKTAGRVVGRPTVLPLPGFGVRTLLGEMGEALLLTSTRVTPTRLLESGFTFEDGKLEPALRRLFER
jgi:hypothetical protein